jgi:hypothetical protein
MALSIDKRPKFSTAWRMSDEIYLKNANDDAVLQHVATKIGGRVFSNICKEFSGPVCTIPTDVERSQRAFRGKWPNTCAVRLSYILNYSGVLIPSTGETASGGDRKQYFYRVKELAAWLERTWGKPEVEIANPKDYEALIKPDGKPELNPDGSPKMSKYGGRLAGHRGILVFDITGWGDAGGHATLFDGTKDDGKKAPDEVAKESCYDHCYFSPHYRAVKARLWELPA